MLELKNINLYIKNIHLFSGDFVANPGQITVVKGKIGSGKTTFYHRLFNLNLDVYINNEKIDSKEEWLKEIAYVNQDVQQYNDLTFQELVDCFRFNQTFDFKDIGVEFIPQKKIKLCSEGEKQRICLLVSLWKNPSILLLDEPTSFLDKENQDRVLKIIKKYTEEIGCITILSTHYDLEDQYAHRCYEIKNKKILLIKDTFSTSKFNFNKNTFDLTCLMLWEKKNIISTIQKMMLLIISLSLFFIGITSYQLYKTKFEWFNSKERYALSYIDFDQAKEIYCKECVVEINDEYLIVGLMNYYDGMNMYTNNPYQKGDIIANDALYRKFKNEEIVVENQQFEITNVMMADMNKSISPYRYMLYIPDTLFSFKEMSEPFYYTVIYENENEIKQLQTKIDDEIQFINIVSIAEQYSDLISQLSGYRMMLFVVPMILGIVLNLIRWILERKYSTRLDWPIWYGVSRKNMLLKIYLNMIPSLLFVLILVCISYWNKEVSLLVSIPYIFYCLFETKLFLKRTNWRL